ncbi:MAG: hypothetical protein OEV76_00895 [Anaerolineae bacterium]|nr:hypothetical protein [Anaerolineae bacterium]
MNFIRADYREADNGDSARMSSGMSEGKGEVFSLSPRSRVRFIIKRRLSYRLKRPLKTHSDRLVQWPSGVTGKSDVSPLPATDAPNASFKAGDLVGVRSREEIRATVDSWRQLKGCLFTEDMWQYCGPTARVVKQVERFLGGRDYRVKRGERIVLLEGPQCEGTIDYGRLDHNWHYSWGEEWLTKTGLTNQAQL